VSIYVFFVRCMVMSINPGLLTGWTVWGSNSGGGNIVCTHQTVPGAHPVGNGSFPRVNRPPSSAEVKGRMELYLYPPLGLRGLF
jgi:hypothetical protein